MLDRDRADVAVPIEVEDRILVEVASLSDLGFAELDSAGRDSAGVRRNFGRWRIHTPSNFEAYFGPAAAPAADEMAETYSAHKVAGYVRVPSQ